MIEFEQKMRAGGEAAIREAAEFFMRRDPVHQTLAEICRRMDDAQIAYAVAQVVLELPVVD